MIPLLLGALAWGQVSSALAPDFTIEDCTARPLVGTVPYTIARQAVDTNAQVYGAVAFAEDVLLEDEGAYWGMQMHNVYGATRIPAAAACPTELQYGTAALDLYASASGLMIPLFDENSDLDLRLFYSGSVTGSVVQFPSDKWGQTRVFSSYGYAAAAVGLTYAAPAAVLLTQDAGAQQMVGDFVAGVEAGLPRHPEVAALRLGYVYSQGVYSNLNSRRLRLFTTALLTDRFAQLSLLKGGFDRLPWPWEQAGRTSLFGRRQALRGPSPVADLGPGPVADLGRIDLTTLHLQQTDLGGGYLDLRLAYALFPRPFLHEGALRLKIPGEAYGLPGGDLVSAAVGVVELPEMPWYAVEGGPQIYVDIRVGEVLHLRRNAPSTLMTFPYAQNAIELAIVFEAPTEAVKP